jgi:hypothetical protein
VAADETRCPRCSPRMMRESSGGWFLSRRRCYPSRYKSIAEFMQLNFSKV